MYSIHVTISGTVLISTVLVDNSKAEYTDRVYCFDRSFAFQSYINIYRLL